MTANVPAIILGIKILPAGTFGLYDVAARSQGAALLAALDMLAVLTEFIGESDNRCMF